jgi:hypothetical protein
MTRRDVSVSAQAKKDWVSPNTGHIHKVPAYFVLPDFPARSPLFSFSTLSDIQGVFNGY